MIFKWYFILAQVIVLMSYFLFRTTDWRSDKLEIFRNKIHYAICMASAIFVGINYNFDYQIFCNPVEWTFYLLIPIAIWLVFFPFLKNGKMFYFINSFFSGLSIFLLFYILLFGSWNYLILLIACLSISIPLFLVSKKLRTSTQTNYFDVINFYGLSFGLPVVLLYFISTNFLSSVQKISRKVFFIPIAMLMLLSFFSAYKMNGIIKRLDNFQAEKNEILKLKESSIDHYYLELVLGTHWKYHTRICLYDGWRPPYHDPIVGVSKMILYPFDDFHGEMFLETRKEIYAYVFPESRLAFECKCAESQRWP